MADYTATSRDSDFTNKENVVEYKAEDIKRPDEVALSRSNHIIQKRSRQLSWNTLGLHGGRDYVKLRLSRYAGESRIDWEGGERGDGTKVTGRRQQSHCFPYLRRIADKIGQHVFGEAPQREGINPEFAEDATADGRTLDDVMKEANDYVTACRWCWIGVDAPPADRQVSEAEKVSLKIRPYLQVWNPIAVKDWKYNSIGELEWLITETEEVESTDLNTEEQTYRTRCIWTPGEVRKVRMQEKDMKWVPVFDETTAISYGGVPFVAVGNISASGHVFDDLESINRTIMDLESVNRANFFKRCYPQLVIPVSAVQNTADTMSVSPYRASELIVGMNYPLMVSKDDASPAYLMPSASDMGAIRSEIQELKHNMFDSVGLMLQSESRQVASAEAKAWDFLDVAQVMKVRAQVLEAAEKKIAQIVNAWDGSITAWTPAYNTEFDIGDFQQEVNALIMASNASMPPEMYRGVLKKLFDRIDRVGASFAAEQREEIEAAISGFEFNTQNLLATP